MNAPQVVERFNEKTIAGTLVLFSTPWFVFWNTNLVGNLGPGDLMLILAGSVFFFHHEVQFSPNKLAFSGILIFLIAGVVSLFQTPYITDGAISFAQYFFIFVVAIPVVFSIGKSDQLRKYIALFYWLIIIGILLLSTESAIAAYPDLDRFGGIFGFRSHTQLTWLLFIGSIYSAAFALGSDQNLLVRVISAGLVVSSGLIIFNTIKMTSKGAFLLGIWVVLSWYIGKKERLFGIIFVSFSVLSGMIIGAYALLTDTLTLDISSRAEMIQVATRGGNAAFPLGQGLGSSQTVMYEFGLSQGIPPVTHNFLFHYYFELGIFGVIGICLLFLTWGRHVILHVLFNAKKWEAHDAAFVAVFLSYLLVAFWQPPPVRRIWWVHFALSWAAYVSNIK